MYIIVTTIRELAEEAKRRGANVFEDVPLATPTKTIEVTACGDGEKKVVNLMNSLSITPNLNGYDYIKYIMTQCATDPKYHKRGITTRIYPECARLFETTTTGVESSIRHSIKKSFRDVPERYHQIFGRELEVHPTNTEFFSMISEFLHRTSRTI